MVVDDRTAFPLSFYICNLVLAGNLYLNNRFKLADTNAARLRDGHIGKAALCDFFHKRVEHGARAAAMPQVAMPTSTRIASGFSSLILSWVFALSLIACNSANDFIW